MSKSSSLAYNQRRERMLKRQRSKQNSEPLFTRNAPCSLARCFACMRFLISKYGAKHISGQACVEDGQHNTFGRWALGCVPSFAVSSCKFSWTSTHDLTSPICSCISTDAQCLGILQCVTRGRQASGDSVKSHGAAGPAHLRRSLLVVSRPPPIHARHARPTTEFT